jgi:IclR family pca regulon transcriptional regulator
MSVVSIERAFRLLRAVADGHDTVSALVGETGLALSTTSRIMGTLEGLGVVSRQAKVYRVGPAIIDLVSGRPATYDLLAVAAPHLDQLAADTGEAAGVARCEGDEIVHLGQVTSDNDVTVRDWTGFRVGAHSGCIGLAPMAYWPEGRVDEYLSRPLDRYVEASVTDPATIRNRLGAVRHQGWLSTTDEYAQGITTVAAPVRDRDGIGVASVHVYGPSYRFPGDDAVEAIGDDLARRAMAISQTLGFRPSPDPASTPASAQAVAPAASTP